MALVPMNLRLEAMDGSGIEEYRIHEGDVEVRRVLRDSEEWQYADSWTPLSPADLAEHVERNTVVAQWLKHRIGWKRLILACTDREILHQFGITQMPIDRHAA